MNLKDKAIKFKGSEYIQVKDRILYLAESEHNYSIETDYDYFKEEKMWVVKAKLTIDDKVYTGLAQEIDGSSFINKTSALENAETSAVGRACAMAGIGVIDSIASIDEINKATNRSNNPYDKPVPTPSDKVKPHPETGEVLTCEVCKSNNVQHKKGEKNGKPWELNKCLDCNHAMWIN